jgi:hypothetical protein
VQVLVRILEHKPSNLALVTTQEHLVGYCVAAGIINRVRDVFSLFDQPTKDPTRPVPPYVQQCLRLLKAMTAAREVSSTTTSSSSTSSVSCRGMDQQDRSSNALGHNSSSSTSTSNGGTAAAAGGGGSDSGQKDTVDKRVRRATDGQQLKSTLVSGGSTLDLVVALQETATVRAQGATPCAGQASEVVEVMEWQAPYLLRLGLHTE